jgi:hypothetical protein
MANLGSSMGVGGWRCCLAGRQLLDCGCASGRRGQAWGASSRDVTLDALTGVPEQRVSKCRVRSGLHRPEPSQLRVCRTLVSSRVLEAGSYGTGYGNGGTVAVSEALPALRLC